jgi:hypothetical protein
MRFIGRFSGKASWGTAIGGLVLAGFVLAGAVKAAPPPARWGAHGHRIATRAALRHLPASVPAFFRDAGEQLEYLSSEPDRWYSDDLRQMDEAWRYDHFIDLENVPPGALDAPDRYSFMDALVEAGVKRPHESVGFLPHRIIELYQRLASGFARWRLTPDGPERAWIQARILNDAGILAHYVVDAAQPHHTTVHYNGWATGAPNPEGFTTDRDFHARFESHFVNAHIRHGELNDRMTDAPRNFSDGHSGVWEFIRASNGRVRRLHQLEKAHGFNPDESPHPETREFVLECLTEGAEMLRAIWWAAWQESDELARRRRSP